MSAGLSARLCLLSLHRCCWLLSSGTSTTVVLGPFQGKRGAPLKRPFTVLWFSDTCALCWKRNFVIPRETLMCFLSWQLKQYPDVGYVPASWGLCTQVSDIAKLLQSKCNFGTMLKLTWYTKVWPEGVRSKHRFSSAGTGISTQQTSQTGDNNVWNHHSRIWPPTLRKRPCPCNKAVKLCGSGRQQGKPIVFMDNVGNTLCRRKLDTSYKGLWAFGPDHSSGHHPIAISWGSSSCYSTTCIIHVTCLDNLSNPWNFILIKYLKW